MTKDFKKAMAEAEAKREAPTPPEEPQIGGSEEEEEEAEAPDDELGESAADHKKAAKKAAKKLARPKIKSTMASVVDSSDDAVQGGNGCAKSDETRGAEAEAEVAAEAKAERKAAKKAAKATAKAAVAARVGGVAAADVVAKDGVEKEVGEGDAVAAVGGEQPVAAEPREEEEEPGSSDEYEEAEVVDEEDDANDGDFRAADGADDEDDEEERGGGDGADTLLARGRKKKHKRTREGAEDTHRAGTKAAKAAARAASGEPSRPLNAYMLFLADARASVREANPDASLGAISKILGERWKEMSAEDQEPYTTRAEAARAAYNEQMAEFRRANPNLKASPRNPKAEGGSGGGGGGGGGGLGGSAAALAEVVQEMQRVREDRLELEGQLATKRKTIAKCAAKRDALYDSADGAAGLREKIEQYEKDLMRGVDELGGKIGAAKAKIEKLIGKHDELVAVEAERKAPSETKRKERDDERGKAKAKPDASREKDESARKRNKLDEGSRGADAANASLPGRAVKRGKAEDDDAEAEAASASSKDGAAGGAMGASSRAERVRQAGDCARELLTCLQGDGVPDDATVHGLLRSLETMEMDVQILEQSGVGKACNKLRKCAKSAHAQRAKQLVAKWKALATQ